MAMPDFVSETVLKRDVFSETHKGISPASRRGP
jgi:hypothetical protein